MINTINVLLSNHSVPFCHYLVKQDDKEIWMMENDLLACFDFAKRNNVSVNVIFPDSIVPEKIVKILSDKVYGTVKHYSSCDIADINVLMASEVKNVIFHETENLIFAVLISKKEISQLPEILNYMKGKYKRLSIVITDIELWNELDLENYKNKLNESYDLLLSLYQDVKENLPEINFITDRWFLKKENGCNAGIAHFTFGPDGNLYLCPAFYANKAGNIGKIENIELKNEQLLSYDHAPICMDCDAYHCNRCVSLNKKMTNEYNIPSYQQCIISHIEREISRKLLFELKQKNPLFCQIQVIKKIGYCDPLEKKIQRQVEGEKGILL